MSLIRVTALLGTPVAMREELHLDGIALAMRFGADAGMLNRASGDEIIQYPPIPLYAPHLTPHHVYCCSAAQWSDDAVLGQEQFTKRRDGEDLSRYVSKWQPKGGADKNRMVPVQVVRASSMSWLAVGSRRGLKKLIGSHVRQLGALRGHGYGVVREWHFERIENGDPVAAIHDGERALRHLPVEWCVEPERKEEGGITRTARASRR